MVNIVLAVTGVGIALAYGLGILAIPTMLISDTVGPRAYPILLLAGMIIVVGMLFFEGTQDKNWTESRAALQKFLKKESLTLSFSAAGILLYFLLFEPLGYLLSTAIFLLGSMLLLHPGRRWVIVAVAVGFPASTYFIFSHIFGTQLPRGLLPF